MRHSLAMVFLIAGALWMATPAAADDLTGSNLLLCTAVDVTVCSSDGDCADGNPWNWNIPQFIEVDLVKKQLGTTKASGENRVTPIKNIERADGMIFLQGIERGRAFSFAIAEETGMASVAVARDGVVVTIFGVCTPTK